MTAAPRTTTTPLCRLEGAGTAVAVRRVETPKGERLELEATPSGERIRLDAVALECLAWQSQATFDSRLSDGSTAAADAELIRQDAAAAPTRQDGALASITNEFAHVDVHRPPGPDEAGLVLFAPKSNHRIRLNAPALVLVARQSDETFSELIRREIE